MAESLWMFGHSECYMVNLIKLPVSQITLGMVNPQYMIGHPETDAVSRFQHYCLEQQKQQQQQQSYQHGNITSTFFTKALGMARPL